MHPAVGLLGHMVHRTVADRLTLPYCNARISWPRLSGVTAGCKHRDDEGARLAVWRGEARRCAPGPCNRVPEGGPDPRYALLHNDKAPRRRRGLHLPCPASVSNLVCCRFCAKRQMNTNDVSVKERWRSMTDRRGHCRNVALSRQGASGDQSPIDPGRLGEEGGRGVADQVARERTAGPGKPQQARPRPHVTSCWAGRSISYHATSATRNCSQLKA